MAEIQGYVQPGNLIELRTDCMVSPDEKGYSAVCINLNLCGQGDTIEESIKKLFGAIKSYITYIKENHPNEIERYLIKIPTVDEFSKEHKQARWPTLVFEKWFKV